MTIPSHGTRNDPAPEIQAAITALAIPGGPLDGLLLGRIDLPADRCPRGIGGPTPVAVRADGVYDLLPHGPTVSDLLDRVDLPDVLRRADLQRVAELPESMAASWHGVRGPDRPSVLAPFDLQVVRACGVTFAESLIERVIEEGARGDAGQAVALRERLVTAIGTDLGRIRARQPGGRDRSRRSSSRPACGRSTSRWASARTPRSSPRRPCWRRSAMATGSACGAIRSGTIRSRRSCWPSIRPVASWAPPWATT